MIATFIHQGQTVDHIPTSDVPAGSVVIQNDLVGVAIQAIPAGQLGALQLTGVFVLPKADGGGSAIAAGSKVYWHPGNQQVTTNPADAVAMGHCIRNASDSDTLLRVRLAVSA